MLDSLASHTASSMGKDHIDLTAVWDQCHSHLRPLKSRLKFAVNDKNREVTVLAQLRLGTGSWLEEPAEVDFDSNANRFLISRAELRRLGVLASDANISAVNARLWCSEPTVLNLEPTTRCNFNCWYCIGRHMKQEDIKVEDFGRVLDHFPGLKVLALVGEGEPLMHKGFFQIVNQARSRGVRVMIISNGSTLSQSNVKKLCDHEVAYVGISIDSADAATFASSRIDGKLDQVWRGIRRLRQYRDEHGYRYPKIGLKGTLFDHTRSQLPEIIRVAQSHGVEIFEGFQPLNPMTNYVKIYPRAQLRELPHVSDVAQIISRDSDAQKHLLQIESFCRDEGLDLGKNGRSNRLRNNCDEQWIYSLLSGDVTPCCQIKTPISEKWNIFQNHLSDILADLEYENTRFNLWNGLFPKYCEGCYKTRSVT